MAMLIINKKVRSNLKSSPKDVNIASDVIVNTMIVLDNWNKKKIMPNENEKVEQICKHR